MSMSELILSVDTSVFLVDPQSGYYFFLFLVSWLKLIILAAYFQGKQEPDWNSAICQHQYAPWHWSVETILNFF